MLENNPLIQIICLLNYQIGMKTFFQREVDTGKGSDNVCVVLITQKKL